MVSEESIKNIETLFNSGKIEEAEKLAKEELEKNGDDARLYYAIGQANLIRNDIEKAKENFEKSVSLNQNLIGALMALGSLYYQEGAFKKAIGHFARVVRLDPSNDKAFFNLGVCHQELEEYENALNFYKKAIELNPKDVKSYYNSSLILLKKGDYDQGFDLYRLRYHSELPNRPTTLLVPHLPVNDIKNIEDKDILVYDEQGIERTIDFIRFMPQITKKAKSVVLRVQDPLEKLLSYNYPDITFSFTLDPESEMTFEEHFPLMDAAYLLKVNKLNIPYKEGYLKIDEKDLEEFKKENPLKEGKNIGIVWRSDEDLTGNVTLLKEMIEVLKEDGVNLYSLQEIETMEEKEILEENGVESFGEDVEDYYDKALRVAALDGVIGIDVPMVHLSGAMGKKTALILGKKSDWLWGDKDKKSAWYETVSLYRLNELNPKKTFKKAAKFLKN